VKEKAIKDGTKKDKASQEVTQTIDPVVLLERRESARKPKLPPSGREELLFAFPKRRIYTPNSCRRL
jgi:hypothetical protein